MYVYCLRHFAQTLRRSREKSKEVDGKNYGLKPEGRSRPFSSYWSFIIFEMFSIDVYIC